MFIIINVILLNFINDSMIDSLKIFGGHFRDVFRRQLSIFRVSMVNSVFFHISGGAD